MGSNSNGLNGSGLNWDGSFVWLQV